MTQNEVKILNSAISSKDIESIISNHPTSKYSSIELGLSIRSLNVFRKFKTLLWLSSLHSTHFPYSFFQIGFNVFTLHTFCWSLRGPILPYFSSSNF